MILNNFSFIFEVLIWLLTGTVVLLAALVCLSNRLQQRVYRNEQDLLELAIQRLFESYTHSGRWPAVSTPTERKALRLLSRRMSAAQEA